ncbi:E3 ubiquitin-protein ligase [Fagus crenata]
MEGVDCPCTSVIPGIYMPTKIRFYKGLNQIFYQPSGTGIDLGFFELDDLLKPSPREDAFPLVIFVETCLPPLSTDVQVQPNQPLPNGHFQVRVIKQALWVDNIRYELREIYGMENSGEEGFDDSEAAKECVICLTEPKDIAVLPCRHMVRAPTLSLFF